jgi:hypothetical protein
MLIIEDVTVTVKSFPSASSYLMYLYFIVE